MCLYVATAIKWLRQPCIPLKPSKPSQDQSSSKQRLFKINVLLPAWIANAPSLVSQFDSQSVERGSWRAPAAVSRRCTVCCTVAAAPASMLLRGKHVMHVCVWRWRMSAGISPIHARHDHSPFARPPSPFFRNFYVVILPHNDDYLLAHRSRVAGSNE